MSTPTFLSTGLGSLFFAFENKSLDYVSPHLTESTLLRYLIYYLSLHLHKLMLDESVLRAISIMVTTIFPTSLARCAVVPLPQRC